jgi:hypothetical protein
MKPSERLQRIEDNIDHGLVVGPDLIHEIQALEDDADLLQQVIHLIDQEGCDFYDCLVTAVPMDTKAALIQAVKQ